MQAAQTPAKKLWIVTPDKESRDIMLFIGKPKGRSRIISNEESSINTLCQEEEFEKICNRGNRESLTQNPAGIEKTISVKEHRREVNDFDPTMLNENLFWNRRPDGTVINKNHQTLQILEFDSHLTEMRIF